MVKYRFVRSSRKVDGRSWARSCIGYDVKTVTRYVVSLLAQFKAIGSFELIHTDLERPLAIFVKYRYCLSIVGRFTKWLAIIPLEEGIEVITAAEAIVIKWIARYGVPLQISWDQGGQLESHLFMQLNTPLGSHQVHASRFHPQANGLVERLHR